MFGSEPFAGTITERPTGSTYSGGSVCRPRPGMQHVRERSRRVVADHEPRVDPDFAQREQLLFGVIDDSTPERP